MSPLRYSWSRRYVLFVVLLAITMGAIVFACGSDVGGTPDDGGGPSACEGSACESGAFESGLTDTLVPSKDSAVVDGGVLDGTATDAGTDAAFDGEVDAAACTLPAADPDAGVSGTLQWALNFGVTGATYPTGVARDPANGDIVVTGYFWGTTDFGGGSLVSQAPIDGSGSDVFVARFDKSGAYKWASSWGNGAALAANTVGVGPNGEMVVAGILRQSTLDFGCGPMTAIGSSDVFLAQFDKMGACTWSKRLGVAGQSQSIGSVTIDRDGSVLVSGIARGGLEFGGGGLTGYFLAKLNAAGAHLWSKAFVASTTFSAPKVALGPQGDAVLAGTFSKSIDFGGGPLITAGADAGGGTTVAFAARFDPMGRHLWSRQYGEGVAGNNTSVSGLSTDACGNVLLHGPFYGTLDFGAGVLTSVPAKNNAFLAKLSPSGSGVWSKMFTASNPGGEGAMTVTGMGINTGGMTITPVLLGGTYQSTVDFGGGPLTGNSGTGGGSLAIATFDHAGAHRWSYVGGPPSTALASVAASPLGVAGWGSSVVIAGSFTKCTSVCANSPPGTTLVLAGRTLTAVSGKDLFLTSFTP